MKVMDTHLLTATTTIFFHHHIKTVDKKYCRQNVDDRRYIRSGAIVYDRSHFLKCLFDRCQLIKASIFLSECSSFAITIVDDRINFSVYFATKYNKKMQSLFSNIRRSSTIRRLAIFDDRRRWASHGLDIIGDLNILHFILKFRILKNTTIVKTF